MIGTAYWELVAHQRLVRTVGRCYPSRPRQLQEVDNEPGGAQAAKIPPHVRAYMIYYEYRSADPAVSPRV